MRKERDGKRSWVRRGRLVRLAGAALVAGPLGVPAPTAAQPPTAETVTVTWHVTSHQSGHRMGGPSPGCSSRAVPLGAGKHLTDTRSAGQRGLS